MDVGHRGDDEGENIVRPLADFPPSVWGDYFVSHFSSPTDLTKCSRRIEELKNEVKEMLKTLDNNLAKKLRLIDELQRLGLEYHFEEEIEQLLREVHYNQQDTDIDNLHITALRFRLLRQQGYNISSGVFNKFKEGGGQFVLEPSFDAKGILELYEACWLGTREDLILEEAMEFADARMRFLIEHQLTDKVHVARMKRALEMPFHRGMRRIEARHFIDMYQEDEASDPVLLELAKLDANLVQSLHQAEIKALSIWWHEVGLLKKLNFARDRVAECFFWSSGAHFEPQHTRGRMLLAKFMQLISVTDDMYDAYGTLNELQLITDVIQKWDFLHVDHLPGYMSIYLNFFIDVIREIEEELKSKARLEQKRYLIELIQCLVRAYLEEAKWANKKQVPTLEEYLQVSVVTSCSPLLIGISHILTAEKSSDDFLDWLIRVPPIVKAAGYITRIKDDIVSEQFEQQRKHVASAVQCCMNDHRATEQDAYATLRKMIEDAWKDMNKELAILNASCSSKKNINKLALNYTRVIEVIYKNGDGYTEPNVDTKENIALLLLDQYNLY